MSALRAWIENGFSADVIALCGPGCGCRSPGKNPEHLGKAWQARDFTPRLGEWARSHRGNIGLRTRLWPAADIDVDEPRIADAIERMAILKLGSTARRTRANTARRLLLYAAEEPFRKRRVEFLLPDGSKGAVEVLANGNQCVVAGTHHTGARIEWPSGLPVAADLAVIGEGQVFELLETLRDGLERLGCAFEKPRTLREKMAPNPAFRSDPGHDERVALFALTHLDPDTGYEAWKNVGMALHSKWPDLAGPGFRAWDEWSAKGQKYSGRDELERKWGSFHQEGGIHFATLLAMAGLDGAGRLPGEPRTPAPIRFAGSQGYRHG